MKRLLTVVLAVLLAFALVVPSTATTHTGTAPTTSVVARPGLGVYNGNPYERPDEQTIADFGRAPDLASTYVQPDQRINRTYEVARMKRGTDPLLTITSKGTQYIAALAAGRSHPLFEQARTWLRTYVDDAVWLAAQDPTRTVYLSFEHEPTTKVKLGDLTGESAKPVNIGKAQNRFFRMVQDRGVPNLKSTWWIVAYDRTFEGTVGAQFSVKPQVISFDPYAHTADDTLATITRADAAWIKSQPFYVGQPIGLSEIGMPVALGDEAMARFYTDVRGQLAHLGFVWAVLFNRTRDNNHKITTGDYPKAVAAFAASLADQGACS